VQAAGECGVFIAQVSAPSTANRSTASCSSSTTCRRRRILGEVRTKVLVLTTFDLNEYA
jgi:hypothetical protein